MGENPSIIDALEDMARKGWSVRADGKGRYVVVMPDGAERPDDDLFLPCGNAGAGCATCRDPRRDAERLAAWLGFYGDRVAKFLNRPPTAASPSGR